VNYVAQQDSDQIGDLICRTTKEHRRGIAQPIHQPTADLGWTVLPMPSGDVPGGHNALTPEAHSRWNQCCVITQGDHLDCGHFSDRGSDKGRANINPEAITH
jgi:hypothetical protein